MRITGMASGMDINSIVDDLMKVRRMPLDKLQKQKQQIEWRRDDYREMNLKLSTFRESFRAKGLALQSTFLQKKVTSSDEGKVTARAIGNAPNTTSTIKVNQLATAARWESSTAVTEDVKTQNASVWASNFDADGKMELEFSVTKPGATEAITKKVTINQTDKISNVLAKLNSELGVSSFLDSHTGKVVMTTKETGSGTNIELNNAQTEDFMGKLGFRTQEEDTEGNIVSTNVFQKVAGTGLNALVEINGFATERTSNTFTVNGMEYTIRDVTASAVSIQSRTDTDKIYDSIMEFVNSYNELIGALNGKVKEDRHRSFMPLSSDEKKGMSEDEVKLWEEKARSGLLKNSSVLTNALSSIRNDLYGSVVTDGVFKSLSAIGLVSSKDWNDGGKIVLDPDQKTYLNGERLSGEQRLRKAIEDDPEGLYKLFMADGPTPADQGILRRMGKSLDTALENINQRAGRESRQNHQFTLGRELNSINDRISDLERRMKQYEDRYFKQFNAMESAMQKANSQAESMFAQLYGGQM